MHIFTSRLWSFITPILKELLNALVFYNSDLEGVIKYSDVFERTAAPHKRVVDERNEQGEKKNTFYDLLSVPSSIFRPSLSEYHVFHLQ